MKKIKCTFLCYLMVLFYPGQTHSQFAVNGAAIQNNCDCFTLTPATTIQEGSVWASDMIDLNTSFDFLFKVFLGCNDSPGADGIVFVLQQGGINTIAGSNGSGLGYNSMNGPSLGIEIDTWQTGRDNPPSPWGDPPFDHIGIQKNGNTDHTKSQDVVAGPVQASATNSNIEDCQWHLFRVAWDAVGKWLRVYIDNTLRIEVQYNIIANIFSANPMVYWGFTGATGGEFNLQQFCIESAIEVNAAFTTNATDNTFCYGTPVTFTNSSSSSTHPHSYFWDFGDGTTSTQENPPPHNYSAPGTFTIKYIVTASDGCKTDTFSKTITIGAIPTADFSIQDVCSNINPAVMVQADCSFGQITEWKWSLNDSLVSAQQQPFQSSPPAGVHQLQLFVVSNYGCVSDTASHSFVVKPAPIVEIDATTGGCVDDPLSFNAHQTDAFTSITQWSWSFGDNQISNLRSPIHSYTQKGTYPVQLWVKASNGCFSDTIERTLFINKAVAFAGNDTIALKDLSFQLIGNGGTFYNWSPSTGLSNPAIQNPVAVLQNDITYILTVTTPEGCIDTDDINIKVFKEIAIYVPTGFTPNFDALNDMLKPKYIGIRKLACFRIFNRWGQLVFSTTDLNKGWDGNLNGVRQQAGVYVWMIRAEDILGKTYELKGTSTLIR